MDELGTNISGIETVIGHWIRLIGDGIDIFGVAVIVIGIVWSTYWFLRRHIEELHYQQFKIRVGRSLLLGLEILVAADIVKTIAVEPSFLNIGVLAGLVAIRTFLSWTLVLEIDGRWPWQGDRRAGPSA